MALDPVVLNALIGSPVAGTQVIDPGSDDLVSSCVFQIANANAFSAIPRLTVRNAMANGIRGQLPLVTGQNVTYQNLLTGAVLAAGTALTANGIYTVFCPGCQVEMIISAGSADCVPTHVAGRVF